MSGELPAWLEDELLQDEEPQAAPDAARDGDAQLGLSELVEEMRATKESIDALKAEQTSLQARYDLLRKKLIPELMQAMNMVDARGRGTVTVAGARVSIKNDVYVSYPKEIEGKVFEELEALGDGGLIRPTLNKNTLRAHIRGALESGRPVPESIVTTPVRSVTLTNLK